MSQILAFVRIRMELHKCDCQVWRCESIYHFCKWIRLLSLVFQFHLRSHFTISLSLSSSLPPSLFIYFSQSLMFFFYFIRLFFLLMPRLRVITYHLRLSTSACERVSVYSWVSQQTEGKLTNNNSNLNPWSNRKKNSTRELSVYVAMYIRTTYTHTLQPVNHVTTNRNEKRTNIQGKTRTHQATRKKDYRYIWTLWN